MRNSKSNIINISDKTMDQEDRFLQQLFDGDAIADNGFSAQLEKRIKRQLAIRRFTLPGAILVGGAIALGPLIQMLGSTADWVTEMVPAIDPGLLAATTAGGSLPAVTVLSLAAALVGAALLIPQLLND